MMCKRMLVHPLILTFICCNTIWIGEGSVTANDTKSVKEWNCTDFGNITKVAHIGWPYEVSCQDVLVKIWQRDIRSKSIKCIVSSTNGTVLWDKTATALTLLYGAPEYLKIELKESENVTFHIKAKIKGSTRCGKLKIHVRTEFSNARNDSCTTFSNHFNPFLARRQIGDNVHIRCAVGYTNKVQISANKKDLSYEWWYNCSKKLPFNVKPREGTPNEIIISNVTFASGGNYTCAIRYKGQLRFVLSRAICLTDPYVGILAMKCPQQISGKQGSVLNVTCRVDRGIGTHGLIPPRVIWYNNTNSTDSPICVGFTTYLRDLNNRSLSNEELRCINIQSDVTLNGKCFQYQPPENVYTSDRANYRVILQIKNLQTWHAGEYTVKFRAGESMMNRTITISIDTSDFIKHRSITIGIGAANVVLIALFIIFCWLKRKDLLWFIKKYFGSYERVRKKYDVGLVYHFSREYMEIESKEMTKKLVESLVNHLENMGMNVYDESKDENEFQHQVQSISQTQSDCHCILVVLNKEFVSDEWSLHKMYTAFKNMIEGGAKVIFLPLPGLQKKFETIPNESKVALTHAMKVATTIKWSGELPFSGRFKRQLEYALPKIQRRNEEAKPTPEKHLMETKV